ncbi:RNA-binding protein [Candidatus Pacearchaeota archaeon]|nr:RNA-binding protein [Candidatus Pacearchaeota archaeon]|tara:strand:- start:2152 stop:2442 length:291 start_codon:yes stop_codon:yes gene_type:complete
MEQKSKTNGIFIGSKPLMNYVTGVIVQFNSTEAKEVIIKSRGKFTSKAIDIAELTKRKFSKEGIKTKDIKIGSEEFVTKEGKKVTVSTLEITMVRD